MTAGHRYLEGMSLDDAIEHLQLSLEQRGASEEDQAAEWLHAGTTVARDILTVKLKQTDCYSSFTSAVSPHRAFGRMHHVCCIDCMPGNQTC